MLLAHGVRAQDWVLVHDAARCLVTPAQINALIDACQGDAVGGLLALPLADTLKNAQAASACPARWTGPTSGWRRRRRCSAWAHCQVALRRALAVAGAGITDESSAMEVLGHQPMLVRGSAHNFKVTYPEDFALAEAILNNRAA
jgi:2-C-methyl-D-erythritol 4-phosphate cytidylyltransferase